MINSITEVRVAQETPATNRHARRLHHRRVGRGRLDAQNHRSLRDSRPFEPGEYRDVRWRTLAQDYVLKKGHRLGLIIAGTDDDYTYDPPTGAKVTVDLGKSSVRIPVVAHDQDLSALIAPESRDDAWRGPTNVVLPKQPREFY